MNENIIEKEAAYLINKYGSYRAAEISYEIRQPQTRDKDAKQLIAKYGIFRATRIALAIRDS
jgi:hypothetical protein